MLASVMLILILLLPGYAQNERAAESQWMSDERIIATVKLPARTMTLKELCAALSKQTGSEFYVDRRHADEELALHADELRLETAMSVVEAVTGLQWRRVDDIFLLTQDARGIAVVKWKERYEQARKAELAGNLENSVREWLSSTMPFPPRIDPVWFLTPLQREQMAYKQALSPMTLTPPQADWLNTALYVTGYKTSDVLTPVAQLATDVQEIPLKVNVAMVLHSASGDFLVEKPLAPAPKPSRPTPPKPKVMTTEQSDGKAEQKTAVGEKLSGLWVTGGVSDILDLAKAAKRSGLDAIFLPVFRVGHSIYPGKQFPQDKKYAGSDPLKQAITAAHAQGLKLIGIVDVTHWGDAEHPAPPAIAGHPILQDVNLLGRRYAEQEEWQTAELGTLETRPPAPPEEPTPKGKDVYLCPASSQAARLLKGVLSDLSAYELDGICLDGVDYPESTPFELAGQNLAPPFGYTVEVRRETVRLHQVDPIDIDPPSVRTEADSQAASAWDKFRRGKLTGLVTELAKTSKSVIPKAVFCVTLDLASDSQSPAHWSKIPGLDVLVPRLELVQSDTTDAYDYSPDEAEALSTLSREAEKSAAVVPAVGEVRLGELVDQLTALGRAVKLVKDEGLRGYLLAGDAASLTAALDALNEPAR